MERFRTFIRSAFSYPRQLYATHPVTTVSIVAATVMFAVYSFIETGSDDLAHRIGTVPMDVFFHTALAVSFFAVLALCLESIRARWKNPVRYALFALSGAAALFMSFLFSDLAGSSHMAFWAGLWNIRTGLGEVTVFLYIGGLLTVAFLLAVYFSYSHNIHQDFNDHIMNCQCSIFFNAIIYGVIQLGVILLTVIITLLLYKEGFDLLPPVLILINGLFYIPALVCAFIKENETAAKFYQILVRYVMLTLSALAYVIIYIYIIKLIITRSVPSNSVYAILTALFCLSMFISYSCTTFEDKGLLQKFAYNSPLIFSPFILMQCYTIFVRIGQYGLTPKRYFGIAFIIFEIIYIVYYTVGYKRDGEIAGRNLLLIICAIIIMIIFIPGINARALSTSAAKHTLSSYLDRLEAGGTFTDREYMRANAAADFLSDDDFGKDRLERYFSGMDTEMIDTLRARAKAAAKAVAEASPDTSEAEPDTVWFSCELAELTSTGSADISGFSKMSYVNISSGSPDGGAGKDTPVDASALPLRVYNSKVEIPEGTSPYMTVDLSDYCRELAQLSGEYNEGMLDYDRYHSRGVSMSLIDINENARLYITSADISVNDAGDPVRIEINGYLFE